MKKQSINFEYGRTKGNNTGLGKNSDIDLQDAMTQAIRNQLEKVGTKGFRICYHLNGVIYSVLIDIDTGLSRLKLEANGNDIKLFAPFSKAQAVELASTAYVVGTYDDLQAIKEKGDGKKPFKNNGVAVEYLLAKKLHKPFCHFKSWYEGSEFEGYEVKYMDFGNGSACTSPRARLTSRKQLEKIGYSFN